MECSNFNNFEQQNYLNCVNYVPPPYVNHCADGHIPCNDNSFGCSAPLAYNHVYNKAEGDDPLRNNVPTVCTYQMPPASPASDRIKPSSLLAKLALPCQASADFDYGRCYSYYADGCYNTCQFVEFGDMEDFM